MLTAVSPIKTDNFCQRKLKHISFKTTNDNKVKTKDVFGKESRAENSDSQYKFLFYYLLCSIAIGGVIAFLTGFGKDKKTIKRYAEDHFKFESLNKNHKIPTIDKCKSLNKDLRAVLERQIKLSKADKSILEETGNPDAANRFILSGPTGVGKSFFSKVYAKSINAEYQEILFSDLNSRWAGEVEEKMSSMFRAIIKQAKKHPEKKYVITFNEIDSILLPVEHLTGESGGTHFATLRRERSTFLTYVERMQDETPNVTIIGTTNLPPQSKKLDNATLGRFQNIIEVPYPDKQCMYEAIKYGIKDIKNKDIFISNNDDKLKELAGLMADRKFSFRNLDNVINEAKSNYLNDRIDKKSKEFKFEYLENAEKKLLKTDGERELAVNRE